MPADFSNPFEPPSELGSTAVTAVQKSKWHGFAIGFRNGFLWSLILAMPTVPVFYAESAVARRFRMHAAGESVVKPTAIENVAQWGTAIFSVFSFITLPWAFVAGCIEQARYNRREMTDKVT